MLIVTVGGGYVDVLSFIGKVCTFLILSTVKGCAPFS